MSTMLPNFGALQAKKLRDTAEKIVERIDFGRQRAVMTGVPHRLAIDLDAGTYKLEWQGADAAELAPPPKPPPRPPTDPSVDPSVDPSADPSAEPGTEPPLSLAPPQAAERNFEPVQGPLGKIETLGRGVEFAWIETPGGDIDFGDAFVTFEADGTSAYTVVVLDEPGGHRLALEILPLAEAVRILDEAS